MRLLSFGENGESVGALRSDNRVVDLSGLIAKGDSRSSKSAMRRLIANFDELREAIERELESGLSIDIADIHLAPPVPDPSKIIAAPVNYVDHMEEMSQESHIDSLGIFLKAPSSLIAHGGEVRLPYNDRRFDQEGELCFVIGKRARNVPASEASDYIFAYCALLDITMRGGEDRSTRKSFDTFTPMGPWLVTPEEYGEPREQRLRCWVDGNLRQDANISDLIWGVSELLSYSSTVMTLEPGDIITTGTPKGVGPIRDGSDIAVEISGLGTLCVGVSSYEAIPSITKGANKGPVPPSPELYR